MGGRPTRWWAGWRLATRIARRDARRYKGRTALVVVMVGLPVVLLAAGATLLATNDISQVEAVPRAMGSAQARLVDIGRGQRVAQGGADAAVTTTSDTPAHGVPGHPAGTPWTAAQVQSLTGGHVLAVTEGVLHVRVGDRRVSAQVIGVDGRDPAVAPMATLQSGRWPTSPEEVLVTPASIARGLPSHGTLTSTSPGEPQVPPRTLTVVGVGDAVFAGGGKADLVSLPQPQDASSWQSAYLVTGTGAVTWGQVQRLNGYGFTVSSRAVLAHPPAPAQVDPALRGSNRTSHNQAAVVLLAAVGIFLETALLAGPAFAVTAARQRRTIALVASNGAERSQLRRYVLALALVLGVATASASTLAGVGVAAALLHLWGATHPAFDTGPFEVPWWTLLGILTCAVLSSLVAAAVPARGASRLDLVSVLRGRAHPVPARRGLPVLGAVLVAAGTGLTLLSVRGNLPLDGNTVLAAIALGAITLVVGVLLAIPATMGLLGRLAARLALPVRIAARDSSRQRGRSAPTVAAIMAAVAALTAVAIGATSRAARDDADYVPQLPMGVGRIFSMGDPTSLRDVASVVATQAPSLQARTFGFLTIPDPPQGPAAGSGPAAAPPASVPVIGAVHPGCSPSQAFAMALNLPAPGPACRSLGPSAIGPFSRVVVMDVGTLAHLMPLTADQRTALGHGGMLVADASLITHGHVTFEGGHAPGVPGTPDPHGLVLHRHWSVPATAAPSAQWSTGFPDRQIGAVITPATATALSWPVGERATYVFAPGGSITPAQETAITEHLDDTAMLQVERGYQDQQRTLLLIVFAVAGLLVLVAALVATALSLAEGQSDMATLAAVGATRHTRRAVAASQALLIGLVGCGLGLLVGAVPGVALTWPLTAHRLDAAGHLVPTDPTVAVPWVALLAVAVGVPLVAALLAAAGVRRAPLVTRRLT